LTSGSTRGIGNEDRKEAIKVVAKRDRRQSGSYRAKKWGVGGRFDRQISYWKVGGFAAKKGGKKRASGII